MRKSEKCQYAVTLIISILLKTTCENIIVFNLLYILTVISCGVPPPPPLRGEYTHTGEKYGDNVTYTCEPGYDVEGNQTLTCDVDGEWGQPPSCQRECYCRNKVLSFVIYNP